MVTRRLRGGKSEGPLLTFGETVPSDGGPLDSVRFHVEPGHGANTDRRPRPGADFVCNLDDAEASFEARARSRG